MKMDDIAKMAGVSKSSVSRVVNNSSTVTPEIQKKVEEVIKNTGYKPNLLAQELVSKKQTYWCYRTQHRFRCIC